MNWQPSKYAKKDSVLVGLREMRARQQVGETFTCYDIAKYCGCRPQNIDQHLQKALRKLRDGLEQHGFSINDADLGSILRK